MRTETLSNAWGDFNIEFKVFLRSRNYGDEFGYEVTASRNMPGMHRISQHVTKDYKELPQLYTDACNELRIWVGV